MWFTKKKNRKNLPYKWHRLQHTTPRSIEKRFEIETKTLNAIYFIWRALALALAPPHIHTLHTHDLYNIFFFKKKNIQILSLVHDFRIVCGFDFFRIRLRWRRWYNIHLWIIIIDIRHIRFRWMLIISQSSQFTFAGRIQLTLKLSNCCTK